MQRPTQGGSVSSWLGLHSGPITCWSVPITEDSLRQQTLCLDIHALIHHCVLVKVLSSVGYHSPLTLCNAISRLSFASATQSVH